MNGANVTTNFKYADKIKITPSSTNPIKDTNVQDNLDNVGKKVSVLDYVSDDYGAGWTSPPDPSPDNLMDGYAFVAYNTNDGSSRAYFRVNGAWKYVDLS